MGQIVGLTDARPLIICPFMYITKCDSRQRGLRIYKRWNKRRGEGDIRYIGHGMERHFYENPECERHRCWALSVMSLKGMTINLNNNLDLELF